MVWQRRGTDQRATGELNQSPYRCLAQHCQSGPLRDRCTRSPQRGRIIKRSEHDDLYDALRQRMRQDEGQAIYTLRKLTVERQFADLKQHRGLRQLASFGLERARIQVRLLVLAQNGLELLKARDRGQAKATPLAPGGRTERAIGGSRLIESPQVAAKAGRSRQPVVRTGNLQPRTSVRSVGPGGSG
ncbi:MAG TPA: transposase [Isosphaeraceae bacterium]|nr:transposase [Isosphaeraceae bacterium]